MVQIIWLVVQIMSFFNVRRNWLKLGMGMISPALDGNTFFSRVCFKIMLLFLLMFNLKSYYFKKQESGFEARRARSPDSCFKNNIKILKRPLAQTVKTSPFIVNLSLYKIQNVPTETGFILILKTRIASLGAKARGLKAKRLEMFILTFSKLSQ